MVIHLSSDKKLETFLKHVKQFFRGQYRYSPLSRGPSSIPLVRLLPAKDDAEPIRRELFEYTIVERAKAYPYEAISYCWGSNGDSKSIIIGNRRLSVTENLYAALLRLRGRRIPRILWIDAIAI